MSEKGVTMLFYGLYVSVKRGEYKLLKRANTKRELERLCTYLLSNNFIFDCYIL